MTARAGIAINSAGSRESRETGIRCVFLTCFDADFRIFAQLLRFGGIRMYRADTIGEADFLLTVTESRVFLCDTVFLDGTCVLAAEMIRTVHPTVGFVLVSADADDACWDEALRLSILTVRRPLRMDELRHAIRRAHEITEERLWRGDFLKRDP